MLTDDQLDHIKNAIALGHITQHQLNALVKHVDYLTNLVNSIMGYDKPELFEGWSNTEEEEYAQLSPVEMFKAWKRVEHELEHLQAHNKQMQSALAQFSDGENWEDEHGVYIWRMFNDPQQLAEHALIHNE